MREGGEDDDKGMVSHIDGVWSLGEREMLRSTRDLCFCGTGGCCGSVVVGSGGGLDGSDGGGGVDGSGGNSAVGHGGESVFYRCGGGGLWRSG